MINFQSIPRTQHPLDVHFYHLLFSPRIRLATAVIAAGVSLSTIPGSYPSHGTH